MARTTPALVGAIIEVDEDIPLTSFINPANRLVTRVCASKKDEDGNDYYTTDELTEIETWLAAHIYTVRDPRKSSAQAGPTNVSYQSKVDLGFNTSHYGQTAMRLDTAGGLAALEASVTGKKRNNKVGIWVLGKDDE